MNRIYRRIWNAARRCWVVASELSSPRTKAPRCARRPLTHAVTTALLCMVGTVQAQEATECAADDVTCEAVEASWTIASARSFAAQLSSAGTLGTNDTVYGSSASTSGDNNAVFGRIAGARGDGTAMGYAANAKGFGAVSVGRSSSADAENSIALGRNASVNYTSASGAIAIGAGARAGSQYASGAIAVGAGASARQDSVALGYGALANLGQSVAIGTNSSAGDWSAALGHSASATGNDSVALGYRSTASAHRVVSVGSETLKRRIVNVDDGQINSTSSDAVTGKQLYRVQAASTEALSVARNAQATASTAQAGVTTLNGLISGSDNVLRLGAQSTATLMDLGLKNGSGRRVTGVADGTLASGSRDAVNGAQLLATHTAAMNAKSAADAALGQVKASSYFQATGSAGGDWNQAKATGPGSLAYGIYTIAQGSSAMAIGNSAKALANNAVALGGGTMVSHANSVAIGTGSVTTAERQVSVGNGGIKRTIVNLADGNISELSNEAVTGSQLYSTERTARLASDAAKKAVADAGSALSKATSLEGLIQETGTAHILRLGAQNDGTIMNVGNKSGKLRTITGIAPGAITLQSSEAVTGSQLFGTNLRVGSLEGLIRQDSQAGTMRLGGENSGALVDVRNKANGNRKITGVADAELKTGSSDAVTGGQLAATNVGVANAERSIEDVAARVGTMEVASRHFAIGAAVDDKKAQAGRLGIAIGDSAVSAPGEDGAVALGSYSRALGENSVALGRASWVQDGAVGGFALGTGSLVGEQKGVALGADSSVTKGARNAVALGSGSIAVESNTASFGDGPLQRRLTNLARGTADHNAITVGQLNDSLATLGGGAKLDTAGNVTAPTYTVQNTRQHTVGDALTILDGAVLRTTSRVDRVEGQLRSVFQDTPTARADGLNQLTLAGANGMILSNVGNGLIAAGSRDAVNGGQLHSMQQQLNGRMDGLEQRIDGQPQSRMMALASDDAGTPANPPVAEEPISPASNDDKIAANTGNAPKSSPQPKAEAPESPKPQVDTAELEKMLARANDYSDGIAREVDARLNKMDKRFNRMAAMSSAQTAMAMNTAGLATYNRLGAGVGYAEGESAMAVGYQRVLNEKGSATFSLNGAFTNSGERSMGVGVGIGW